MDGKEEESVEEEFWIPHCLDLESSKSIYHSEWRNYLNEKNKKEVYRLVKLPHCIHRFEMFSRKTVNFFCFFSKNLGMSPDVSYLALDILDRACNKYAYDSTDTSYSDLIPILSERQEVFLMAFSCLQIASKLSCMSKILTVSLIIKWMKNFGYSVNKKLVVLSELSVLKKLNCILPNVTLLTYVEMFLENMVHLLGHISRSELLEVAVKIINVSFIFHKEIYTKLHIVMKQREIETSREKQKFMGVEGDAIRLAASIVCSSSMLLDPSYRCADTILEYLVSTTSYSSREIRILNQILLSIILRVLEP